MGASGWGMTFPMGFGVLNRGSGWRMRRMEILMATPHEELGLSG